MKKRLCFFVYIFIILNLCISSVYGYTDTKMIQENNEKVTEKGGKTGNVELEKGNMNEKTSFKDASVKEKAQLSRVQRIQNLNSLSDGNLKLNEKDGQLFLSGKLSTKQVPGKESAIKFLEENKLIFGITSLKEELKVIQVDKDNIGHTYVKLVQVINGIELNGSLINVHFDKSGVIVSVNGKLEKNKSITEMGSKVISENEAVEIAKKQFNYTKLRDTPKVQRLVFTKDNKNYETFKINISYIEPTIANYDVFVEVRSGNIIHTENNIRFDSSTTGSGIDVLGNVKNLNLYQLATTYQMRDLTKSATSEICTYSLNHGTSTGYVVTNNNNFFGTEDHKASVSAHYNAGRVVDFYKNIFGRNSLDDNGMIIRSFTHYSSNYNNAFWDGYEMVYGDGDGNHFTYLSGDLDVVGHEMTHGVIDHTADLYYHNQSGALNESMADVFGILISTYDKYNVASGGSWSFNSGDWVVGDDIYTPNIPGDALRCLSNPTLYGQPGHISDYQYSSDTEDGDWGGVHINSGIPNKAAYLVAQAIGMEKTAKIYYRALVNYMSVLTDFEYAKNCLVQAAADLYGQNSSEVVAINNAYNSIGIGQPEVEDPYEPNDNMESAYPITMNTKYQSYITEQNDVDIYKLNIGTIGDIHITLSDLPFDYDLRLYDSNGQFIDYSGNGGTIPELIDFTVVDTGDYYIRVNSFSGASTTQKYSLIVTAPPIQVDGVSLNQTTASLEVGSSLNLEATINPSNASNKNVTWSSTNTSIATVDSTGKVTAIGKGESTITVTTEDGGYAASCNVTVTDPVIKVTGVSVDKTTANLNIGRSLKLIATVNPTDAFNKDVTWSSTNTAIATVDSAGKVTAVSKGTATILVTTKDGGYEAKCAVAVIEIAIPTEVKAISSSYNSINVSWKGVTGASGYEIYRSTSSTGKYSKITTTSTATAYKDANITTGTTYYYKVRAYKTIDAAKVYGNFCDASFAKPIPAAPTTIKAESINYSTLKLTWDKVTGSDGYKVYRSTSKTGTYSKISNPTTTSYNNTGLKVGTTYYYKVRAYKTVGNTTVHGNYSSIISAKPIPETPANLNAISTNKTTIRLTWGTVSHASGYEVYSSISKTGKYNMITRTTSTSYNNTKLTPGKIYYYKVRAYKIVGSTRVYSNYSSIISKQK